MMCALKQAKWIGAAAIGTLLLCNQAGDAQARCKAKRPAVKNIILLIGDGMQLEHEIATSRYLYGWDFGLKWNWAPFRAPVSTWDVSAYNKYASQLGADPYDPLTFDPAVGYDVMAGGAWPFPFTRDQDDAYLVHTATDSASAATAWATGYKTDAGNIAWLPGDAEGGALTTIAEYMRDQRGAAIGVVSTVPFTHATPAAHVAHNVYRNNYGELAEEIIMATRPEVVIGGGAPGINEDGTLAYTRYLPSPQYEMLMSHTEYVVAHREPGVDGAELLAAAADAVHLDAGDKLFGLYGGPGGNFESPIPSDTPGAPSIERGSLEDPLLRDAAVAALEVLSQDPDGLFIMIEQGDIDWANHANDYARMVGTTWDLEQTLAAVAGFISRPGDDVKWNNTLVILTSDHSNSHLRLNDGMPFGRGDLPTQEPKPEGHVCPDGEYCGRFIYPDGDVTYGSGSHTNELVMLYAFGRGTHAFAQRRGEWYPGTRILDNTQLFEAMAEVTNLSVD